MTKTIILTHADTDGICAGALALSALPGSKIFFTKPVSLLEDLKINSDYQRMVICDIALTKRDAAGIIDDLQAKHRRGVRLMYFDHHPLPSAVKPSQLSFIDTLSRSETASASEIVYLHFQNDIPRERVWAALYGAIADFMDETPFVRERILNWDRRTLYFEVSTVELGIKNEKFGTYNSKREIVQTLAKGRNPSDITGLVQSARDAASREFRLYETVKRNAKTIGRIAYVENTPSFGFRGASALFAATVRNRPVGLCIIRKGGQVDITMRGRDPRLNLGKIAEAAAEEVGGSGGGLAQAAGGRVPRAALPAFLKRVSELI